MIDSSREEFEKLPEIAKRIAESNSLNYDKESNGWRSPEWDSTTCYNEDFVNAAWYAFQEQQKKLDCCREENRAHLEKIDEAVVRCKFLKTNGGDRRTLEDIELILKGNKDEN